MSDPYNTPHSDIRDKPIQNSVSLAKLLTSTALMVISGFIYIGMYLVIPQFEVMFQELSAELPVLSLFILKSYPFYGTLYLIGLLPFIILLLNSHYSRKNKKILFTLIVSNFILTFVVMMFVLIAMYLPVFYTGTIV